MSTDSELDEILERYQSFWTNTRATRGIANTHDTKAALLAWRDRTVSERMLAELEALKQSQYAIYQDIEYTDPKYDFRVVQLPVKVIDDAVARLRAQVVASGIVDIDRMAEERIKELEQDNGKDS